MGCLLVIIKFFVADESFDVSVVSDNNAVKFPVNISQCCVYIASYIIRC